MKESKLTAVVIGAGMIANKAHIPAYLSLPDKVRLEAVSDPYGDSARQAALQAGIPRWFTDAEQMLKDVKPDLVSICTPNMYHAAFVRLALENGANVLCEKPLALTWRETKGLYDLARAKEKMLMACQTMRYSEDYMAAKELAQTGMLGIVYFAEFAAIRRRGIPKWGDFHRKQANGGGCLCDLGVHMIDAALWLMDSPKFEAICGSSASHIAQSEDNIITGLAESGAPAGVTRMKQYKPEEFEVEEFAAGTVRFQDGLSMNFKTSWALNLPPQFSLSLAGSKAGLSLPDLKLYSTLGRYQTDITPRVFREGPYAQQPFAGHFHLIRNAVDHLLSGEECMVTPEQTLSVSAIIDAFYLSAAQHREVLAEEILSAPQ